MPTVELYGFGDAARRAVVEQATELLQQLPFSGDIVLTFCDASTVVDLNGTARPFFRVGSRSAERRSLIRDRLVHLADVETFALTDFVERPRDAAAQ